MKKFVNQLFKFSTLAIFYIIIVFYINMQDCFKVFGNYNNYYEDAIVDLNREFVTLASFKSNFQEKKYNSFIFGSSRSLAYKIPEWEKHLKKSAVGFHFDATGEGIYGIYNKLAYLKKNKTKIDNALIVLDYNTLETTENRKGHLSISPPELSGESQFEYYKQYIWASANINFIKEFLQYKFFKKYSLDNKYIFPNLKNKLKSDYKTGDIYFKTDSIINDDSKKYYAQKISEGVFYERINPVNNEVSISKKEILLLNQIFEIIKQDHTNCKIIISPLYDQKKLSNERLKLVMSIFGKQNVFDFSGKNKFTESIYSYYESSHYRPKVANTIMNIVYKN